MARSNSAQMNRLALGSNCHRCGASVDEECRTPSGRVTNPHTARVDRAVAQYVTAKRVAEVEAIADAAEPAAPAITSREELIARQIARGVSPERAAMIADARDLLQAELTRNAPAIAAVLADEADVPPTDEERVTVRIRASELRPGDLVVDSLGARRFAAFDVHRAGSSAPHVKVWTAIRDQEDGLPPTLVMRAERELLVSRPMSEEGRELAARAGWFDRA